MLQFLALVQALALALSMAVLLVDRQGSPLERIDLITAGHVRPGTLPSL